MYSAPKQATLNTSIDLNIDDDLLNIGVIYQLGMAIDLQSYTSSLHAGLQHNLDMSHPSLTNNERVQRSPNFRRGPTEH